MSAGAAMRVTKGNLTRQTVAKAGCHDKTGKKV